MLKRFLKDESGVVTDVIAFELVFLLLYSIIFGGYCYVRNSSLADQLNYDVGHSMSSMDSCNSDTVLALAAGPQYSTYNFYIQPYPNTDPELIQTGTGDGADYNVFVSCPADWSKGSEFQVTVTVNRKILQVIPIYTKIAAKIQTYYKE